MIRFARQLALTLAALTLAVVAATAKLAPKLRRLDLRDLQ